MEFKRKKKKGQDRRHNRLWVSECGNYRITWTNECCGVPVTPHYFAMVRCYISPYGPDQTFTFAGKRGPYAKFVQAEEACVKNEKLWLYAIQVSEGDRKGRNDRLRAADMKARIGKGPQKNRVLGWLPAWVRPKANSVLMNLYFPRPGAVVEEDEPCSESVSLTPSQNDPTDLSLSSEQKSSSRGPRKSGSKKTRPSGPASDAPGEAASTTPTTRRVRLKAINSAIESPAPTAKAPPSPPEPSSTKRTRKLSKATSPKGGRGKKGKQPSEAPGTS
jgi:hypothetical protein